MSSNIDVVLIVLVVIVLVLSIVLVMNQKPKPAVETLTIICHHLNVQHQLIQTRASSHI